MHNERTIEEDFLKENAYLKNRIKELEEESDLLEDTVKRAKEREAELRAALVENKIIREKLNLEHMAALEMEIELEKNKELSEPDEKEKI